jgi:hypothetical protein
MYKAIFYQDQKSFEVAKKAASVVESVEPFFCVVTLDTAPTPGTASRVKNTLFFSDLDHIPTNRAIITLQATGGTTNEAAVAWLSANKVTVVRDLFNFGVMIVELPKGSFLSFTQKVQAEGWFGTMEEDLFFKAEPLYAFTYGEHWHLGNIEAQEAWNLMAPYASNVNLCNDGPRPNVVNSGTRDIAIDYEGGDCCTAPEIALLDVGVQTQHPDLRNRFGTCGCPGPNTGPDPVFTNPGTRTRTNEICSNNWNIVNNNSNVEPQFPYENHGTAMAGIIAGNNLNNNYTLSVSNNYVKVQALRIGYTANAADFFYTTPSWTLEGLYRASVNPSCAAIVISWRVTTPTAVSALTAVLAPAFDYINNQARNCTGIPIFAAAGNSNSTDLSYPAEDGNVLAIAASNSSDERAYFSNKGAGIFIAAPGIGVRTTDRTGPVGYSTALADPTLAPVADINFTNYATTLYNGTSPACGIVGAIAGCLRAVNPALTSAQIQTILQDTATAVDPGEDIGAGIVNMQAAVQEAIDLIDPVEDLTVTVGINSIAPNPATLCGGLAVVTTEVIGSGATWGQVTAVTLEYFASADNFLTSTDFLLESHTFPVNNVTDTYTYPLTIPNVPTLTTTTKLIVRATLHTNCGQIISNGATEFISSAQGFTITTANCPGTDLAIEVTSVNIPYPGQRVFQIKYTNTGTVPITTANITRGWIGGASNTFNVSWTGTTSQSAPIQPGQQRIIQQSYNTPAPQWPGIYYIQINTVNGGTDFNTTNNYSTLIVNS